MKRTVTFTPRFSKDLVCSAIHTGIMGATGAT